jgi:nitroreductase
LEAARWAPSGANSQPWEFIVIIDKKIREKIIDIIAKNLPSLKNKSKEKKPPDGFKDAPIFIIVVGDTRRKILLPGTHYKVKNKKITAIENKVLNIDDVFTTSLANAFLYIQLAIKTLEIGSQWITATAEPEIQTEIKKLLKIPNYLVIYDTVALGYPAITPKPRFVRPLTEIIHFDHYNEAKSKTDRDIILSLNMLMRHEKKPLDIDI